MPISTPSKITVPWATSGLKNAIPAAANNITGAAGYDNGFPAITMTPKVAGGIPPQGQDFNGALFDVTTALQFLEAGGSFPFDSAFATAVGGYPLGSVVSRSDGSGLWRTVTANNLTDPEAGGSGWQPEDAGSTAVVMTSSNLTLTPLQAAKSVISITGTLTANLNLILPTYKKQWSIINNATGAFTITVKTLSGSGVALATGSAFVASGDGVNIYGSSVLPATEATPGIIRKSTSSDATTGTDDASALTPLKGKAVFNARGLWDVSIASGNANTARSVGLYSLAASTPNAPTTAAYQMISSDSGGDPTWQMQQAQGVGVNSLFIRSLKKDQSATTGWSEVYTTANNNMVGSSVGFYLNSAPAGWLKENGAAVSRTTYAALFAIIGTAFGAGDGSTTFNLPDHRGEFPRGTDDTRGIDPGRLVGSTQAQAIQSHSHAILDKAVTFSFSAAASGNAPGGKATGATELTGGTETRPRNIAKLYCIKF